jgi:hypothetical protein
MTMMTRFGTGKKTDFDRLSKENNIVPYFLRDIIKYFVLGLCRHGYNKNEIT